MKPQVVPNGTTKIKPKTPTEKQVNALGGLDDDALLHRALESLHALNRRAKKCRDTREWYRRASFAKVLRYQVDHIYQLKDRLLEALVRSNLAKVEKFSVVQITGYAFDRCEREWFPRASGSTCFSCGEYNEDGDPKESKRTWFIVECHGLRFHRPTLPDDLVSRAVEVEPHDPTQPQREMPKIGLTIAAQTRCIEMMAERLEARVAELGSAEAVETTLAVAPFGPVKCSTGGHRTRSFLEGGWPMIGFYFGDDQDLLDRASRAYFRFCEANGFIYNQPNQTLCEVNDGVITLANCNGVLAVYQVTKSGRIRRRVPLDLPGSERRAVRS